MTKADGNTDLSSLAEIDRLIHEPARLAVMALLYVVDSADFVFLMNQTELTWGNLSAHISKLEEAGYLTVVKTFKGKRPNTMLQMTVEGRDAFRTYTVMMRKLFSDLPD